MNDGQSHHDNASVVDAASSSANDEQQQAVDVDIGHRLAQMPRKQRRIAKKRLRRKEARLAEIAQQQKIEEQQAQPHEQRDDSATPAAPAASSISHTIAQVWGSSYDLSDDGFFLTRSEWEQRRALLDAEAARKRELAARRSTQVLDSASASAMLSRSQPRVALELADTSTPLTGAKRAAAEDAPTSKHVKIEHDSNAGGGGHHRARRHHRQAGANRARKRGR